MVVLGAMQPELAEDAGDVALHGLDRNDEPVGDRGVLVRVDAGPLPGVDVLRYSTALNYTVLGVVVMACVGLSVTTMGALALRVGLLARWAGPTSIGLGLVVLVAVAAMYGAYAVPVAILWSLVTAVAVLRRPEVGRPETAVAEPTSLARS